MIEQLKAFPDNVLAFVCTGRVTKADYDAVVVPTVMKAIHNHDKVRLYYETDRDFCGIDSGAVWEDFKIGMEHFSRWERIALVSDIEWIRHTMQFFSFMIPGEMKIFPMSDASKAREWIAENANMDARANRPN